MAFKMKGSKLYGKLKLNRNMDDSSKPDGRAKSSAFQRADILIGGESIGSGSDKQSSQLAEIKANEQKKLNKHIKEQNKDAADKEAEKVSDKDWNENVDKVQHKYEEDLKKDITTKSGKTLEHKEVEYTGEDKKRQEAKEKAAADKKRQDEVDAHKAKQKKA